MKQFPVSVIPLTHGGISKYTLWFLIVEFCMLSFIKNWWIKTELIMDWKEKHNKR